MSLAVMLLLFTWAQSEATVAPTTGQARHCHAHMQRMHHDGPATAAHLMPSGCCPKHASRTTGASLPPSNPSDCCFTREQPARPGAFLVASGFAVEPAMQAAGPNLAPSRSPASWELAGAPPFTKPVLSLKTDLRI